MKIAVKNHRKRNFYLIHQDNQLLRNSHNISQPSINIFEGMEPVDDYFPTCPADNPFKTIKIQEKNKQFPFLKAQLLPETTNKNQRSSPKIPQAQQVYKVNKNSAGQLNTISDTYSYSCKKYYIPPISSRKGNHAHTERAKSHEKMISEDKWDKRVNKYLFKKSIQNQIAYKQDLRTRCGQQYFEQALRDRHKEQKKPVPFVYSIKNQLEHDSSYLEFIKNLHPQIMMRNRMILKGINRNRRKTEQSVKNRTLQSDQSKIKLDKQKNLNQSCVQS